jgi:hypothetical protein
VIHERPFWNCRGIKKKGVASYIRDMVKECNFDFVCFQETIVHEFSDECFRKIDPHKIFCGIGFLLKEDQERCYLVSIYRFDVGCRVQDEFMLQHTV